MPCGCSLVPGFKANTFYYVEKKAAMIMKMKEMAPTLTSALLLLEKGLWEPEEVHERVCLLYSVCLNNVFTFRTVLLKLQSLTEDH